MNSDLNAQLMTARLTDATAKIATAHSAALAALKTLQDREDTDETWRNFDIDWSANADAICERIERGLSDLEAVAEEVRDELAMAHVDLAASAVLSWDPETSDVGALRAAIRIYSVKCRKARIDPEYGGVDFCFLPSAPVPFDVDLDYPVWAVDSSGGLLVGPELDDVTTLAEYRRSRT